MAFVNSNDIYAFPVATRGVGYPLSRLTTEKNITNILDSLIDEKEPGEKGFVLGSELSIPSTSISYENNIFTVSVNDDIEFIIKGYYFKTKISDILTAVNPDTSGIMYGAIKLDTYGDSKIATTNQQLKILQSTNVGDGQIIDINNTSTNEPEFVGINFLKFPSGTVPTGYDAYIPLFDLTVNSGSYSISIPRDYHYKLNQESINLEWNVLSN